MRLISIYKPNVSKIENSGPLLRKSLWGMQGMRTRFPTVFNGVGVILSRFVCVILVPKINRRRYIVTMEVKLKIVAIPLRSFNELVFEYF